MKWDDQGMFYNEREQRIERSQETNHLDIQGQSSPGRRSSRCKAPKWGGGCLASSGMSREASVAEAN